MSRERNVVNYYVLCNRLKNVIRTGGMFKEKELKV